MHGLALPLQEPSASREPLASREPSASREPLASREPSASREPLASKEPSAGKKPLAGKKPSAGYHSALSPAGQARRSALGALALLLVAGNTSAATVRLAAPLGDRSSTPLAAPDTYTLDWGDGVQITASADSVLRCDEALGERRIHLIAGQLHVTAESSAGLHGALRPTLVISSANVDIYPLGTQCVINQQPSRCSVGVSQGRVAVIHRAERSKTVVLKAGEQWHISA